MAKAALAGRRWTVEEGPEVLEVTIPSRIRAIKFLFLLAWLGAWAHGEMWAINEILFKTDIEGAGFLLFWLTGWTVGGCFAIYVVAWMIGGKERVLLDADSLSVRKEIIGIGRRREFTIAHVSNLRVSPVLDPKVALASEASLVFLTFWGAGGGKVAFDCGGKTHRFGIGLDEVEAGVIIEELAARHGFECQR